MKRPLIKVLLIEDDEDDVLLAREYLSESEDFRFEVAWEPKAEKAKQQILTSEHDIFLIDYRLGSQSGLDLIKFAHDNGILTPCILLTGQGDMKVDLEASRSGAADYLVKTELNAALLERSIRYSINQAKVVRELDEKEKRYRSLFERSIDPIFLANNDLKLVDINESFLSFFHLTREAALHLSVEDLFLKEEDYDFFKSTLKELEQIRDFEIILSNKKGEKKSCLINCVFIPDQASEFCCYQGIVHDLTERKKAERDMLIAEKLSMTGKIARTIAHEVRNPLTNLNLALEQMKDEMPKDNESVKLYSDIIERNAARIEQLIGEMLNSSKPKELNVELVRIPDVIEETLALAVDRLKLNQMKLETVFDDELPRVLLDKEKIKIALLNIFINATEAMEAGKGLLQVQVKKSGRYIIVTVADNGKGIAPEDIEKLFDPFYTAKQGGMGLGLTSTKNILSSHNADIDVTSIVNGGTTFSISFKLPQD